MLSRSADLFVLKLWGNRHFLQAVFMQMSTTIPQICWLGSVTPCVALQIIVQVAIKAARPAMDASFSEPLRRLIAKCWAQVPQHLQVSLNSSAGH